LRSFNFEEKGKMDKNAKNLQPIPAHGDYRKLGSYQMVKIVYDVTVLFCDLFISKKVAHHARWFRRHTVEGTIWPDLSLLSTELTCASANSHDRPDTVLSWFYYPDSTPFVT